MKYRSIVTKSKIQMGALIFKSHYGKSELCGKSKFLEKMLKYFALSVIREPYRSKSIAKARIFQNKITFHND